MPALEETVTNIVRESIRQSGGTLTNEQITRLRPVINRVSETIRTRLRAHPNTTPAQLSELAEPIVTDLMRPNTDTRSELITLSHQLLDAQGVDRSLVSDDMIAHTFQRGRTRGEILNAFGTVIPPENVPSLPSLLGPLLSANHDAIISAFRAEEIAREQAARDVQQQAQGQLGDRPVQVVALQPVAVQQERAPVISAHYIGAFEGDTLTNNVGLNEWVRLYDVDNGRVTGTHTSNRTSGSVATGTMVFGMTSLGQTTTRRLNVRLIGNRECDSSPGVFSPNYSNDRQVVTEIRIYPEGSYNNPICIPVPADTPNREMAVYWGTLNSNILDIGNLMGHQADVPARMATLVQNAINRLPPAERNRILGRLYTASLEAAPGGPDRPVLVMATPQSQPLLTQPEPPVSLTSAVTPVKQLAAALAAPVTTSPTLPEHSSSLFAVSGAPQVKRSGWQIV